MRFDEQSVRTWVSILLSVAGFAIIGISVFFLWQYSKVAPTDLVQVLARVVRDGVVPSAIGVYVFLFSMAVYFATRDSALWYLLSAGLWSWGLWTLYQLSVVEKQLVLSNYVTQSFSYLFLSVLLFAVGCIVSWSSRLKATPMPTAKPVAKTQAKKAK